MSITAANVPIKMKDGTEYRFSPLSDKAIDEMENWVKARIIQIARDANRNDENTTPEEKEQLLSIALRQSSEVSILSPRSAAMIATIPGMLHLCWLSLRREHPNIIEDDLRRHMMDPENIDIINEAFEMVNNNPFDANKNGEQVKKNRRKKKIQRVAKKRNRKGNQ